MNNKSTTTQAQGEGAEILIEPTKRLFSPAAGGKPTNHQQSGGNDELGKLVNDTQDGAVVEGKKKPKIQYRKCACGSRVLYGDNRPRF